MNVKVIAILHCDHDAEKTFEQELKRLVEASVNDEGCLKYELYQYKDEPCQYIIIEDWQDDASQKKHQETPHYQHFKRLSPVLLSKPAKIKTLVRLV